MVEIGRIAFRIPDTLEDDVETAVEEYGYQNKSDFGREAVRRLVKETVGNTPEANILDGDDDDGGVQ